MDTSNERAKSKITNGTSLDTPIGISKSISTSKNVKNRIRNGKLRIKEHSKQPTKDRRIIKLSKQDTVRRIKESQNLIKKGFNVCYALEEFIRASRDNEVNKKQ